MNLKRVLIDLLTTEQLKDLCFELELEADRRSPAAMTEALTGAKRAKPERLIVPMTVAQLREALVQFDRPTDGKRDELVQRLLEAGGRAWPLPGAPLELEVQRPKSPSTWPPETASNTSVLRTGSAEQYRHADEAVQRPDAGVQDQFQVRKPPRTYRYDSSLDPAMSWDEQRERDLGEWLLGMVVRAAKEGEKVVFAEPQLWAGGGVRITSLADAAQMLQQISKPFLNWAGKAERHQIQVPTAPLFVHERHSTKAILDGIRHRKARGQSLDLFGDVGMDIRENLEAYEHRGPWQNRLILGDSLSVMNSLLEFEGMASQVQMIYMDPPYGVQYGSNFQPFVRNRKVSAAGDEDLTREPEMVKAYRDTWELGLHSYLTYLRDRLLVARDLLSATGSIFVQISDQNLHHVRQILDEVFGPNNFVACINYKTMMPLESGHIESVVDYICWNARDKSQMKYRNLYVEKRVGAGSEFVFADSENGGHRRLSANEIKNFQETATSNAIFKRSDLTSSGYTKSCIFPIEFNGKTYTSNGGKSWRTTRSGVARLIELNRLFVLGDKLYYKLYLRDFGYTSRINQWTDTIENSGRMYVVQTTAAVIERCMLMCTDPGDLVVDPTCGSGTTAYVAEQWGRRWISADTSRVPLALARQRLLTATFPYYELKSPQSGPAGGFVYKRKQNRKGEEVGGLVPHITLKSIANDEPPAMEVLVDRPEEVSGVTRVAGPFVVEATIAPVQPIEASGESETTAGSDAVTHIQRMTELLRQSKTLRLSGNREVTLTGVRRTVDTEYLHAEAKEGDKRVAIVFGPADGAVSTTLVYESGREAHYLKFDRLYFFGFAVEPGARAMIDDEKKLRIPAAYVAVTPDVAMSDLLKTTRASEIFSVIAAGGSSDETRRLRFVLETVGKTEWLGRKVPEEYTAIVERHNRKALEDDESGLVVINPDVPPGRDVRCIISVSMLSEGWDATTVTHVVGLRPFGSQLLCEQVVGRALRRTSYAVDAASGLFTEETAQIFGVPFELIPFKVEGGKPPPPTPPANHVYAVPEQSRYEIEFPVVEGYQDPGIVKVKVDWDRVGELVLDPDDVPDDVLLRGLTTQDGRLIAFGPGTPVRVNLEAWRQGVRVQQVAFELAKVLVHKWQEDRGDAIPAHRLFPQMLDAASHFIEEHVNPVKTRTRQDLAINPYFGKAVAMIVNAMGSVDGGGASQERAVLAPGSAATRSTHMVNFHTGKPLHDVSRCHLNAAVFDSDWERQAADLMGAHPAVSAWVKNDRLGLVIPYRKEGTPRKYLPDFIIELNNGEHLVVEIKGQVGDAYVKKAAAERWCRAVSNDARFGVWRYALCFGALDLT